jgi:hypothetical protein
MLKLSGDPDDDDLEEAVEAAMKDLAPPKVSDPVGRPFNPEQSAPPGTLVTQYRQSFANQIRLLQERIDTLNNEARMLTSEYRRKMEEIETKLRRLTVVKASVEGAHTHLLRREDE